MEIEITEGDVADLIALLDAHSDNKRLAMMAIAFSENSDVTVLVDDGE